MASDYIFTDENQSPQAEAVRAAPGLDKWLKRIILVVAGILGAELLWLFGISPFLPLSVVEVDGVLGIDRAALLAQAGISPRSSYMTVNAEAAEGALETLYQVASARVLKQYPDTVRILLEPRRGAAFSLVNVEGRMIPVVFDKQGVIINIGYDSFSADTIPALPIISGLAFERVDLGMRLPPLFNAFLARLDWINRSAPELLTAISEIRINKKVYDGFDLTLYPIHDSVKFRVEADLDEDMLRYMLLMIDVFGSNGVDVEEVDLRTGMASYFEKEASSG